MLRAKSITTVDCDDFRFTAPVCHESNTLLIKFFALLPTLAWFVCINKRHQPLESPSHVHRSSANWISCGMYVSVG